MPLLCRGCLTCPTCQTSSKSRYSCKVELKSCVAIPAALKLMPEQTVPQASYMAARKHMSCCAGMSVDALCLLLDMAVEGIVYQPYRSVETCCADTPIHVRANSAACQRVKGNQCHQKQMQKPKQKGRHAAQRRLARVWWGLVILDIGDCTPLP